MKEREIKFRAFIDPAKTRYPKKVIYWNLFDQQPGLQNIFPGSIGQFTGLHDKDGAEIYEGDLVNWKGEHGEVLWDLTEWRIKFDSDDCPQSFDSYYQELEVIGNIHQNPLIANN